VTDDRGRLDTGEVLAAELDTDFGDPASGGTGARDFRELVLVRVTQLTGAVKNMSDKLDQTVSADQCEARAAKCRAGIAEEIRVATDQVMKDAVAKAARTAGAVAAREASKAAAAATAEAIVKRVNGHKPFWPQDARGWLALIVVGLLFLSWLGVQVNWSGPPRPATPSQVAGAAKALKP